MATILTALIGLILEWGSYSTLIFLYEIGTWFGSRLDQSIEPVLGNVSVAVVKVGG